MTPMGGAANVSNIILIVDDDEDISTLLGDALKKEGADVRYARDGEEGIRLAKEIRPRLLLLDLHMPRSTGFEVCEAVRADPALKGTVIVMTSAQAYVSDVKTAKDLGANAYIVKPYIIREVIAFLKKFIATNASPAPAAPPAAPAAP